MSIIMSNHHGQSSSSRNPHGGIVQCPMAVSHNFKFAHFRRCPLHLLRYTAEQNNTFENMYTIDDYNWVPSNSQLVEVLKLSLFSLSFTFNCKDATSTNNENTVDKVPYHEKYLNLSAGPRWNSLHSGAQEKGRGVNKGERSPSLLSLTPFRSSDNWGLNLRCHHHYHYLQIIGDWKYVAILSIISDNRGLEIRCHGDGSPLSVDLHRCRPCWHCWHYTSGGRWWYWW